jgi:hypothetical protein
MEIGDISKSYLYGIGLKSRRTELLDLQMSKLAGAFFARLEPLPLPSG